MTKLVHILRMRVQTCSVRLCDGRRALAKDAPWLGRDYVVFHGTLKIQSRGRSEVTALALHSGTMLLYSIAKGQPGGFIEIDYSGASEDRGFFGVTAEVFDRLLAVALAHLSGHQASMEIQFPLVRFSKSRSKIRIAHMSFSYGEQFYFAED
jgi:hypothetical protein